MCINWMVFPLHKRNNHVFSPARLSILHMPMHGTAKIQLLPFLGEQLFFFFGRSIPNDIAYRFWLLFTKSFVHLCSDVLWPHPYWGNAYVCDANVCVCAFPIFMSDFRGKAHAIYCVTLSVKWYDLRQHSLCYAIFVRGFSIVQMEKFNILRSSNGEKKHCTQPPQSHAFVHIVLFACFVLSLHQAIYIVLTGPHKIQCAIERKSNRFFFVILNEHILWPNEFSFSFTLHTFDYLLHIIKCI